MSVRGALLWIVLVVPYSAAAGGLPRAGTCGACHGGSFETWRGSAHARSISGTPFRDCLKGYLAQAGTDAGDYCFRCHAPESLMGGGVFAATREIVRDGVRGEGVSCAVCHSVAAVVDGAAVYDANESRATHHVKDLRSLDRQALCTICHSAYESRAPAAAGEAGFLPALRARIGAIVGAKAGEKTDHAFPEATVAAPGHWACGGAPPESG